MRITNNMMMRNTKLNINNNKENVNTLNNQMSSQKKIDKPSEDPVVADSCPETSQQFKPDQPVL